MEDRHSIHLPGSWQASDPDLAYLGVYDGHGGRDMVDFLEHAMPFHVAQELEDDDDSPLIIIDNNDNKNITKKQALPSMETRLERAFLMADLHARQVGITASGATVAICLVKPVPGDSQQVELTVANAGDARVVLGQGRLPAERLSVDHRVDDPKEVQRIAQAGGFCWKGRVLGVLAVTRSLGDQLLKEYVIAEPAVRQVKVPISGDSSASSSLHTVVRDYDVLESSRSATNNNNNNNNKTATSMPPTFVILACDGLWDVMSDQEAVDIVREFEGGKQDVAKWLVQEGLTRGSTDNLTVIVAWL
ncbi:hypothetical protein ACA910_007986 [Epithemia clementina (nom. ined.)]